MRHDLVSHKRFQQLAENRCETDNSVVYSIAPITYFQSLGNKPSFIVILNSTVCDRVYTEKRSLISHMKNQHGNLWSCHRCSQSFNRRDNYEMHQRACLLKITRKRSGGHLGAKKLKGNASRIGGTLVDYRLDLEGEQQDA